MVVYWYYRSNVPSNVVMFTRHHGEYVAYTCCCCCVIDKCVVFIFALLLFLLLLLVLVYSVVHLVMWSCIVVVGVGQRHLDE